MVSLWLPEGILWGAGLGEGKGWCNHPAGEQGQKQGVGKGSDPGYIVNVEPKGFAEGSGVVGERRGARMTSRFLA